MAAPSLLRRGAKPGPAPGVRASLAALPQQLASMGVELPAQASVVWPRADPRQGGPRMHTQMGVGGRTVVLGVIEMYAQGGASVGADATPRGEDRNVILLPTSTVGLGARPLQNVEVGLEVSRRGPLSFDPRGDEARGMANLRWRFRR